MVLHFVTSPDQTWNVPGRSILDNLYLMRDSFEYIFQKQFPIAMISLDQEKAFDRLNWEFLDKGRKKMNFGEGFRKCVRLLYTEVNCNVTNNGHSSKPIRLTIGARQGCPLSPLLYILVAETLANLIRQNPDIEGLCLPGSNDQVKISQYADDATLLLRGECSVCKAFEMIETYEKGSGSKLNMHETKGMWLDSKAGQSTGPIDIQ